MADLCRSCGQPIERYHEQVYAIQGYEERRSGGGAHHVLEKQRLDGWTWHKRCWESVMRRHQGRGEQGRLL